MVTFRFRYKVQAFGTWFYSNERVSPTSSETNELNTVD